ncbi:acyl-CoA thioesterase [Alcaligenaceae bacterium]|nr:acyl-CoA thioesterase [Alcaligenaceae bacterium]
MSILTAASIEQYKVEGKWRFYKEFDVRWGEVDGFGHVSHRTHLVWFEEVRNAYFSYLGYEGFHIGVAGPVIKELGVTYEKPLGLADRVLVTARFSWMRNSSFQMDFAVWHEGMTAKSHAVCVWLLNSTGEKQDFPDFLRKKLIELDQAEDLR